MDRILIRGGNRLSGKLPISGAKNSALTLMPCSLLTEEPVTLRNLPRLADVDSFGHLLNQLGVSTEIEGARPSDFGRVMTMRAGRFSFLFSISRRISSITRGRMVEGATSSVAQSGA